MVKVRVTWWEKQYYESVIELDKLPETDEEKRAAHDIAADSDGLELGDTVDCPKDEVFEEVKADG